MVCLEIGGWFGAVLNCRFTEQENNGLRDDHPWCVISLLQASAPLDAYHSLCEQHSALQTEYRKRVEEAAGAVMGAEELLRLREDLANMHIR